MPLSLSKLLLLLDQAQVAIEERNRISSLGLSSSSREDADLRKNLQVIRQGIEELEIQAARGRGDGKRTTQPSQNLSRLIQSYKSLVENYGKDGGADITNLEYVSPQIEEQQESDDNDDESRPLNKSVRFKDNLIEGPDTGRERQELFTEPYRDDPEATQTDGLDSSQLYTQQQQVMRGQDERLDRLGNSVSRQHELSIQIDDELTSHLELLDDVDNLVDSSHSRLETAKRQLDKFSRKARENGSFVTIIILIFIFIILIVVLK
jgi:syntaxin 8